MKPIDFNEELNTWTTLRYKLSEEYHKARKEFGQQNNLYYSNSIEIV